jgi:hypothetical protein
MVSDNLMNTMRCSEAFSIASEPTLYVFSEAFRAQLINITG